MQRTPNHRARSQSGEELCSDRIVLVAGVAIAYLVTSWASTGRTIGAQVFGLCVVTERGELISTGRAIGRASLCGTVGGPSLVWGLVGHPNQLEPRPVHAKRCYGRLQARLALKLQNI
ncbi:hypothetical protein B4Q13_21695 [Lacticaseibacillus rhamnosus]